MSVQRLIKAVLILGTIAAATVMLCLRIPGRTVNVDRIITEALMRDGKTNYTALVETEITYMGKKLRAKARILHSGPNEKIVHLGPGRESAWSITRENTTYTYLPKDKVLLISNSNRSEANWERIRLLLNNYRVACIGEESVAGHKTYVMEIRSRRFGTTSKKLWIDKRHHTLLRSVDYSATGKKRSSMNTIRISYGARIEPAEFYIPSDPSIKRLIACTPAGPAYLSRTLKISVRSPRYVPKGYVSEGHYLYNSHCNCNHRSAQLTYTDGLNTLSVFETPINQPCRGTKCNMQLGNSGHTECELQGCEAAKTGQIRRGNKIITVVGDITSDEIRRIVESVP